MEGPLNSPGTLRWLSQHPRTPLFASQTLCLLEAEVESHPQCLQRKFLGEKCETILLFLFKITSTYYKNSSNTEKHNKVKKKKKPHCKSYAQRSPFPTL